MDISVGRRELLGLAALMPVLAAWPQTARAALPDLRRVRTRTTGKVETLYKTPHYGPNGMWMTPEGMWIIHQIDENYATLINLDTGQVLREIQCEGVVRASGICLDEAGTMWIGSTYNRLIVACDAGTGKVIAKYSTPGAGQIYKMTGDPVGGRTPMTPAYPAPQPAPGTVRPAGRRGAGQQDPATTEGPAGTGAHCILPKGDLLYIAVPPARAIFAVNKATWVVENSFPSAGDRPHDMVWANEARTRIWSSDSNYNAFFLHDAETGKILERVNLPAGSPIIHGAKLVKEYMYMCDDVGWMNRVRF